MNTGLQVFSFQDQEVRTVTIDGEIWVIVDDACKVLDISNARDATSRLDLDGVVLTDILTPGGWQIGKTTEGS